MHQPPHLCCSCSCFAAGAAAARRAHHASDRGNDGGDARGSTTTTVDARTSPMPNSWTTQEMSLPPQSLGILRGAPPSPQGRGGEGGGGRGGGSAGASGWLSRRLMSCRRGLLSSRRSAASCPLTHLLPFASCTPTLPFASCLPAGCHVAPVDTLPPTSPRAFTSASSLPSGRRNSQRPTCRAAAASRLLDASASRCTTAS